MANHVSHAALPYPIKGARFTLGVPYLDADGDPTDPTTPDTERSIDGAAFADCTEEVSTISGSNGSGYLTLTGDEMNASVVQLAAKVASGPKATLATLYPRVLPVLLTGTAAAGAAGTITLASSAPAIADILIGCIVRTTGGTGGAGGSGSQGNQARVITAYSSGRVATVVPNWETTPDNTTTYEILVTEASLIRYSDVYRWNGTAVATPNTAGIPVVDLGIRDSQLIRTGTAQAGAASSITLDASASATNSFYIGELIYIVSGTGAGQARMISAYSGSTKVASVNRNWQTNPDNTSVFAIVAADLPKVDSSLNAVISSSQQVILSSTRDSMFLSSAVAQAGSTTTITLHSSASSVDDFYNGFLVRLDNNTGLNQIRTIVDYVGSTRVATVSPPWIVAPDNTTQYALLYANNPAIDVSGRTLANSDQINGVAAAAAQLAKSAATIVSGTAITGTLSSTQMTTDLTEATNDHYVGRRVIWTSGVLQNAAAIITAYDGSTKMLTYTTTPTGEAPSNNDTFNIV